MANAVASYDQLAHQVEVLRKENSHLRRELEDNSNHLSKLETETFGMKVSPQQTSSGFECFTPCLLLTPQFNPLFLELGFIDQI